jgi:hypothetical protein
MKTASENFLSVVSGKQILFLESDDELCLDLEHIETFINANNINNTVLCDLGEVPFEKILEAINNADVIIFQTTWVTEISTKLSDYIFKLKDKKYVIEVYIDHPTWYYRPKKVPHEVYIMKANGWMFDPMYEDDPLPYWKFYKLRMHKPFWTYKNNFDN